MLRHEQVKIFTSAVFKSVADENEEQIDLLVNHIITYDGGPDALRWIADRAEHLILIINTALKNKEGV